MGRRCYQCGDEDLAEVQARRTQQIREWAKEQNDAADAAFHTLIGVPGEDSPFNVDLGEEEIQEIPQEQEVPEVENDHEVPANSEADLDVDATAKAEEDAPKPKQKRTVPRPE